jgi:hypothetical protein
MASFSEKVVDRTKFLYKSGAPAEVEGGKALVLGVLNIQPDMVRKVEFLENFQKSSVESAISGEARYQGLVVSLDAGYKLSTKDRVWMNGMYGECSSVFPMQTNHFIKLEDNMMVADDSTSVAGTYETHACDPMTGETDVKHFCVVNISAGDTSRELSERWTLNGMTIKEAYECAATEKLAGSLEGQEEKIYDSIKDYTSDITHQLAGQFHVTDASTVQTSNGFVRSKGGGVHFLNAAIPSLPSGSLCHVSPLHGYVVFPHSKERNFYPSNLLASGQYVDVNKISASQRNSIFTRANWNGDTTVNPYALRKQIQGWNEVLPKPETIMRMRCANFARDPRESEALQTRDVLMMTPSNIRNESIPFPEHVRNNLVRLHGDDRTVMKLVTLRNDKWHVLNPEYYEDGMLTLPRELAEKL